MFVDTCYWPSVYIVFVNIVHVHREGFLWAHLSCRSRGFPLALDRHGGNQEVVFRLSAAGVWCSQGMCKRIKRMTWWYSYWSVCLVGQVRGGVLCTHVLSGRELHQYYRLWIHSYTSSATVGATVAYVGRYCHCACNLKQGQET